MSFAGAAFTAAVCWALGTLLFRALGLRLERTEHNLLASLTGAALLSLAVLLLCAAHIAYTPVFCAFALLLIPAVKKPRPGARPRLTALGAICTVAYLFYAVVYLANSLAPETSPDGMAYHLGFVARYFHHHGFEPITTNMYAAMPEGAEMLFLFAFAIGRHSAAATVHCFFLFLLPLLMVCYGRRIGHAPAGMCAAMLFFLSPLAGIDGVSAYNDVALASAAFGTFYLLEIWRETCSRPLLIPIGLLAGFCYSIKYTGFVALLYMAAVLRGMPALRASAAAAAVIFPWMLKNWLWLSNPFAPFLNRLFPNPYFHISFERGYTEYFRTYGLPSLKPLFRMVTVTGELGGQIGPVFLLAPLALLSLRSRAGRRCLFAALFFLIPYPANIGARFLLPALPFIALALALALESSRSALVVVVIASAILAWPRVIDRYRAPAGGWQITTVPWQAALGILSPETYLERRPEYRLAREIDLRVPAGKRVFSTAPLAEAYMTRDALVNYYSAAGESIEDILLTAVQPQRQPLWNLRFTFPATTVDHLRFLQTAGSADDIWSVGEARFFSGDREIRPSHADADNLAIDGNPVTRWRTWEAIRPGMHLDVRFPEPVQIDRAELHCSHDQWHIAVRLQGIAAKLETLEDAPLSGLRRLAVRTTAARGIDYLVVGNDSPLAADIRADPSRWDLTFEAEQANARLYKIR